MNQNSLFIFLSLFSFSFLFSQNNIDTTSMEELLKEADSLYVEEMKFGDLSLFKRYDAIYQQIENRDDALECQKIWASFQRIKSKAGIFDEGDDLTLNSLKKRQLNASCDDTFRLEDLDFYYLLYQLNFKKEPDAIKEMATFLNSINKDIAASAYYEAGTYYYGIQEYTIALNHFEKAQKLFSEYGYNYKSIMSENRRGACCYYLDDIDASLMHYTNMYEAYKTYKNPDLLKLSRTAFNLGMMHQGKTSDLIQAEYFLKEAIRTQSLINENDVGQILNYALLADNYFFQKDISNATFYAEKADILANEILQTDIVYYKNIPRMSLIRIHSENGEISKARNLGQLMKKESVAFYGEDHRFTCQVFIDNGFIEEKAGNLEIAEEYLLKAVSIGENINRVYSHSSALQALSDFYYRNKQYENAYIYAVKSLDLVENATEEISFVKIHDKLRIIDALVGLNKLDEATQRITTIKLEYDKSPLDFKEFNKNYIAIKQKIALANFENTKNTSFLISGYELIDSLIEQIIALRDGYKFQESQIFFSKSISKDIDVAFEICNQLYKQQPSSEIINTIFKLSEINKSSALLDGIQDLKLHNNQGDDDSVFKEKAVLLKNINDIKKEFVGLDTINDIIKRDSLSLEKIRLSNALDVVIEKIKTQYPKLYNATYIQKPKDISYYQKNIIEDGQLFLSYYLTEEKIFIIGISKRDAFFNSKEISINEKNALDGFSSKIENREEIDSSSTLISNHIIPEIKNNVKELFIIADDILNKIPFEILKVDDTLLLRKYAVSYLSSLALYKEQLELPEYRNDKWVGFAPSYTSNNLSANQNEVSNIKDLMDGEMYTGATATKSNFINQSDEFGILHIAAHGVIDPVNPTLNKLYFAGVDVDEELTTTEIYGLNLPANLAVLSACKTGSGKIEQGEGVMSLSRAFNYAGVASTLVSLWEVPDKETSQIMINFYKNLESGLPKNEALRKAKLSYVDTTKDEVLKHPFYWAGFVINGDVAPIKSNFDYTWWIAIAVAVVFGFLLLFLRKRSSSI